MDTTIDRVCEDCRRPFNITPAEQTFLERLAAESGGEWQLPKRCYPCRQERRRATQRFEDDGQDEWLVCADCDDVFIFGGKDKAFFAAQGFAKPKRCRPCRERRRTG